jgi:hypothetical protein
MQVTQVYTSFFNAVTSAEGGHVDANFAANPPFDPYESSKVTFESLAGLSINRLKL